MLLFQDSSSESSEISSLCLICMTLPDTNWPWGREPITVNDTKDKIGSISSIGYCENKDNTLYALSVIQSKQKVGDDVIIRVGLDEYKGTILNIF